MSHCTHRWTRNVQCSGLPRQGEQCITCVCQELSDSQLVASAWSAQPGHTASLRLMFMSVSRQSVLPATRIRTTVYPERASSVKPENLSVWMVLLVLYKSFNIAISEAFLYTQDWLIATRNYSEIVLCLNMPEINSPASDSRSLGENCPLSHAEPYFLLASLGSCLFLPAGWGCLQGSPQRGGSTKKACAVDSCWEWKTSSLQWSVTGHIHYTPGQAP